MNPVEAAEDARSKIMAAAARLFAERGSLAASVGDVIEAAGVSKGAFYHHFSAKDDLIVAVFDAKADLWFTYAQPAFQLADPLERAVGMVMSGIDAYEADPEARCFIRLLVELTDTPGTHEHAVTGLQMHIEALAHELRLAQEQGTVRPELDPEIIAGAMAGGFTGIEGLSYQLTGGADFRRRIEGWMDLLVQAITTEKEAA